MMAATDAALQKSLPLLGRDLCWLESNQRVLHEAEGDRTPLLERVKFLAIFSSNLDEFFMKRVELLAQKRPDQTAPVALEQTSSTWRQAICEKIFAMMTTQARVYA
jgi:polyphosphate kinase